MKPLKITPAQYEAAYKLGLEKARGKTTITEALLGLQAMGVNRSSAADMVYNTTHLINGRSYKRMLGVAATDDYLKWILRDFDGHVFQNAVTALEGHIHYYETLKKVRLGALRDVLSRHKIILKNLGETPIEPLLIVDWKDRASKGWVDLIPLSWFEHESTHPSREHIVESHDSGEAVHARCNVTVHSTYADLDYEAHAEFNTDQDLYLGVARLLFTDSDRTSVAALEWRPKGAKSFEKLPAGPSTLKIPNESEYEYPSDQAPHTSVQIRERPGQAAFRRKLKGAYNHACCITDCNVSEVLEGAHIDDYRAKASDNLKNGLLLRSDIHTLYDRQLIAIHPTSHTIQLAKSIRTSADYASLHGKKLRLPDNATHHPSPAALERRWHIFTRAQS